jgi:hypothetical protein
LLSSFFFSQFRRRNRLLFQCNPMLVLIPLVLCYLMFLAWLNHLVSIILLKTILLLLKISTITNLRQNILLTLQNEMQVRTCCLLCVHSHCLGPRPDTSESTLLCVLNIPRDLNTIGKIDEHFSKFGPIVNIEILQNEKKARVKFSSHRDAVAAMKSPEVCAVLQFFSHR